MQGGVAGDLAVGRHLQAEQPLPVGHQRDAEQQPGLSRAPEATSLLRDFPDDLRPSRLVETMAHVGTAIEYTFPLLLAAAAARSRPWRSR